MEGDHKAKKSSDKRAVSKKKRVASQTSGILRGVLRNDDIKIIVKGITAAAALISVVMLIVAGADLRPSAVVQGFRDKYAFTHASGGTSRARSIIRSTTTGRQVSRSTWPLRSRPAVQGMPLTMHSSWLPS